MSSREDPDFSGAVPLGQMHQISKPSQGSSFGASLSSINNILLFDPPAVFSTPDGSDSDQGFSDGVSSGTANDVICQECYEIDFQKVLQLDSTIWAEETGVLIADLGTRLASASSGPCTICRLFAAVARKVVDGDEQIELELRAFSFLRFSGQIADWSCRGYLRPRDQPFLAVVPRGTWGYAVQQDSPEAGYIFCRNLVDQQPNVFSPRIIPCSVDFSLVNQWLEYCESRHKRLCGDRVAQLSGLRVIDCDTLSVISAPPSCSYAALSYVWSNVNRQSQGFELDRNNATALQLQYLPRSIQDAVAVTKGIGLRYLWVDRFCIDQRNPDEKHHQIQNMDTVYSGAEITIVAAAGLDEDYGLPGVGLTTRAPQLRATVKHVQIVCTMIHPHETIVRSVWSTRGWAYQEAVLSRRRIVFTDHQLYFECNAMTCSEGLEADLDTLHTKDKQESLQMMHGGIFAGRDRKSQRFGPMDLENLSLNENLVRYLSLITNFSSRELTFEEDSLNAFKGIARHLAKSRYPLFHLWGLPFPPPSHSPNGSTDKAYLSLALLWVHFDHPSKQVSRRPTFPSWSWVGWGGQRIYFPITNIEYFASKIQCIYFEFGPDRLVEQSYFLRHSNLEELDLRPPRGLHLDVLLASPTLLSFSKADPHSWMFAGKKARLRLSLSEATTLDNPWFILEKLRKQAWVLVYICATTFIKPQDAITWFMIVAQHNAFMSKIGVVTVYGLRETDIPSADLSPSRIRLL
ncbi:hypothetical protein LTR46_005089 [Exophiala xenobiotica]|nr:hypothetical protein LTR46_005089 [Exophiala xenobiotica]